MSGWVLVFKNEEGEDFLDGAGTTGEGDEGIGTLDHDFHAGVDVISEPEAGESRGEAFETN